MIFLESSRMSPRHIKLWRADGLALMHGMIGSEEIHLTRNGYTPEPLGEKSGSEEDRYSGRSLNLLSFSIASNQLVNAFP
jgi:hypothetical protein